MDDRKTDKNTVFVRGVSFDVQDRELNDFFSDIGPVRQAFLVKSRGGAKHKGYGFVQFALQTDAERAATELNGKELQGRKLQVEVAIKRAPLEERKRKRKQDADSTGPQDAAGHLEGTAEGRNEEKVSVDKAIAIKQDPAVSLSSEQSLEKHRMLRAVAVGCLTPGTHDAGLQLARAAGEVEEVVSPIPQHLMEQYKLERDGCKGTSLLVIFKSVKDALAAVAKVHGQELRTGQGGASEPSRRRAKREGVSKCAPQPAEQQEREGRGGPALSCVTAWARQVSGEGLHLKRWRLIVRNLPFKVTEAELRGAFQPAGFIWELTLPRTPDGRPRGFAFLGFTCRAHAEKGIKMMNAQQVAGRPVAVDWALSKNQMAATSKGSAEKGEDEQIAAGHDSHSDIEGERQEGKRLKQGDHRKIGLVGHEGEEGDAQVAPEQERDILHSVIDDILGGDAGAGGQAATKKQPNGGAAQQGATSDDEAGEAARAGGAVSEDMFSRRALIERSAAQRAALERLDRKLQTKPVGRTKGDGERDLPKVGVEAEEGQQGEQQAATVFVRGLPLDVTKQQVLTKLQAFGKVLSCRLVVDKESGRLKGTAFADYVEAQAAVNAAEACAKARRKEGPGVVVAGRTVDVDLALEQEAVRNLAVQKAGERGPRDKRNMYLAKEGAIAEGSKAWEEMSQQDRNKRKRAAVEKKTKLASPNFLVSTTRLSVRNIPHTWTERQLKELFTKAVVERASKARPQVKQAKILLEENAGGVPRSKGIGFVEFDNHEHALCALRQLNNNPQAWGKERRPIIEFAIENAKILKAREAKLARAKQSQQQQQQQQGEGEEPPAKRIKGRQQGNAQQQQQKEGQEAEGLGGVDQLPVRLSSQGGRQAEGGEVQQQQSKRQRRREIKQKLRAVRQQKAQEAAAAAAMAAQQKKKRGAKDGVEGPDGSEVGKAPENIRQNKAKKRRELRKAKKQGGVTGVGVQAASAAPLPIPAAEKPPSQQVLQGGVRQAGKQHVQGKGQAKTHLLQRPQKKLAGQQGQGQQRQGPNTKSAKAAQQAQHEQQAKQRKRSADDELDSMVAGMTGGPKQLKQRKKMAGGGDRLDQLAAEYRAKFFDGVKTPRQGSGKGKGTPAVKLGLKRWFE